MSMVAGDYPTLLQPPDALKRRSSTQTYGLPEVLERELTVCLEQYDDMSIDMIKLHTNNILILWLIEKCHFYRMYHPVAEEIWDLAGRGSSEWGRATDPTESP
jgi:hypothetical protein